MPYIFIKYLEYKTGLVVPTILSYSTMGWWKVSPMMVDMGLFHAFGVANMLEMNPSDVRLLVFPLLSSSQHWQRLTPMFWPWLKLRPFRSFQYSMWCSATPRYFFYSMFNIFRKFRDFPLVWHFFLMTPEMIIISWEDPDISTVVCYISQWIIFPLIEKRDHLRIQLTMIIHDWAIINSLFKAKKPLY